MPCKLVHNTDWQTVRLIRTCKAVKDKQLFFLQIRHDILMQKLEFFFRDRLIDRTPVDFIVYRSFVHNEFILWRAACKLACQRVERPFVGQNTFATLYCHFDELGYREVEMNLCSCQNVSKLVCRFGFHV